MFPPMDLADRIKNSLLSVAPPGLSKVCTLMCGTCANENAFKAAFVRYMVRGHCMMALGCQVALVVCVFRIRREGVQQT